MRDCEVVSCDEMEEVKGANSSNGTGPSVLLADDDEPNRAREVRMLCKLGCRVTVVRNGGHVLRALELRSFDIILMDCRLMVLDGLQTSREIRHMGGALSSIPIIAMSPSAMLSIQRKCLEAGMQEKIRKPVCLREMRATLLRWLPREIAKSLRPSSPSRGSNGTRRRTRPVAADPVSERLEELSCSLRDHSFLKEQLRHLRESATQRWLEIDAACHSGDLAAVQCHVTSLSSLIEPLNAAEVLESCVKLHAAADSGDRQALIRTQNDLKRRQQELLTLLDRSCSSPSIARNRLH